MASGFVLRVTTFTGINKVPTNTTLATSKIAIHIDLSASCLTLFAWLAERRYQLLCPGIELRKRHHAKVVLST